MRLWQGRLQGFRTDTEITPAVPAPSCARGDLLPALREPNPTCQGLLAPSKGRDNGDFHPPFWGGSRGTGELPTQQGEVFLFKATLTTVLKHIQINILCWANLTDMLKF